MNPHCSPNTQPPANLLEVAEKESIKNWVLAHRAAI